MVEGLHWLGTLPSERECARPDPVARDLRPPERPDEERRRWRGREREDDGDAALFRFLFVLALQSDEDSAPARRRGRGGVHGKRRDLLLAAEHHPVERVRRDADDLSVVARHRHERSRRVAREPPVELVAGERIVRPRVPQQTQVFTALRRLVRRQLVVHYFVEVPSAALKRRRACVPVIVSFTEIRSHAPASTSSNVRGEYGSML